MYCTPTEQLQERIMNMKRVKSQVHASLEYALIEMTCCETPAELTLGNKRDSEQYTHTELGYRLRSMNET